MKTEKYFIQFILFLKIKKIMYKNYWVGSVTVLASITKLLSIRTLRVGSAFLFKTSQSRLSTSGYYRIDLSWFLDPVYFLPDPDRTIRKLKNKGSLKREIKCLGFGSAFIFCGSGSSSNLIFKCGSGSRWKNFVKNNFMKSFL